MTIVSRQLSHRLEIECTLEDSGIPIQSDIWIHNPCRSEGRQNGLPKQQMCTSTIEASRLTCSRDVPDLAWGFKINLYVCACSVAFSLLLFFRFF